MNVSKHGKLFILSGSALVMSFFPLAWFAAPSVMPVTIIKHSPWVDLVLRAGLHVNESDMQVLNNYIISFDPKKISQLRTCIFNTDERIRNLAVSCLMNVKSDESRGLLAEALYDPNVDVRKNAVLTLGYVGGERSLALVKVALTDPDDLVVATAKDVIMQLERK